MEKRLPEIKRKSLVDHVVERLFEFIINERLQPGDRLPTENQLADQLKVGRGTIREAVGALSFIGIVEVRPKTGTRLLVSSSELKEKPFIRNTSKKPERVEELVEARIMLEQAIVELASKKARSEDIEQIRKYLDLIKNTPPDHLERLIKLDISFHFAISKASHNSILNKFLLELRPLMLQWMRQTHRIAQRTDVTTMIREHEEILTAIDEHDVDKARLALTKHLYLSAQNLDMALLKRTKKTEE